MIKIDINADIKALIFDCDGTLVDSMPLHMKAWEEAFSTVNAKYEEQFLYDLKGMKESEIIELYNKTFNYQLDPLSMVKVKHSFFNKNINNVKPLMPVVEIAHLYHGKLPLAVVSGSVRDIVHKELSVINIFHLFKVIFTADDPFKPKPAPDIFLAAAEGLGVHPQDCLVFEDGDPGLQAAVNAGMKTIDIRNYL